MKPIEYKSMYRNYDWAEPYQDSYVCVTLNSNCMKSGNFVKICQRLEVLHKRFGLKGSLIATSPSEIGQEAIHKLLEKGHINQFIFSGHARYLLLDTLASAKRLPAKSIFFVCGMSLINGFADILKFLVENSYLDSPIGISASRNIICADIHRVQTWNFAEDAPIQWGKLLALVDSKVSPIKDDVDKISEVSPDAKLNDLDSHFFITAHGLERLGGFERMLNLPLAAGGLKINSYDNFWIIDNNTPKLAKKLHRDNLQVLNGFDPISLHNNVVYDINPAPWVGSVSGPNVNEDQNINLPRQLLYVRNVRNIQLGNDKKNTQATAVFIMSNYNKDRYIQSSIYSLLCQTYPKIAIEIVDDGSNDESLKNANELKKLFDLDDNTLRIRSNSSNRGTYWIRNYVISEYRDTDSIYFINDSDDYSAAQRAFIQSSIISESIKGCIGDIVRVDSEYSLLPLNDQVERYGTASLSCQARFHSEIGYFQNFRKNADTEFMERVKKFVDKSAIPWFRYPVLFQPFDGNNLTADIYEVGVDRRKLNQSLGNRAPHTNAIRAHHSRLNKKDVPSHFAFPLASIPNEYLSIGQEYFMDGYRGFDACLLIAKNAVTEKFTTMLISQGFHLAQPKNGGGWRVTGPGCREFFCDFSLPLALSRYIAKTSFYGYFLPFTWINSEDKSPKELKSFLNLGISNDVLRSKSESDRLIYVCNEDRSLHPIAFGSAADHFRRFENEKNVQLFLHTEAFLKENLA